MVLMLKWPSNSLIVLYVGALIEQVACPWLAGRGKAVAQAVYAHFFAYARFVFGVGEYLLHGAGGLSRFVLIQTNILLAGAYIPLYIFAVCPANQCSGLHTCPFCPCPIADSPVPSRLGWQAVRTA